MFPRSAIRTSYQVHSTAGQCTSAAVIHSVPRQQPNLRRVTHVNSQQSVRHSVTNRTWSAPKPCTGLCEIIRGGRVELVCAVRPLSVSFQMQSNVQLPSFPKLFDIQYSDAYLDDSQASPDFHFRNSEWQIRNDNGSGQWTYWDKNSSQCHLANQPGINTALSLEKPATNCPNRSTAILLAVPEKWSTGSIQSCTVSKGAMDFGNNTGASPILLTWL